MSQRSTKLHELLAVEGNLENQATKLVTEHTATFGNKRHLFEQKIGTFLADTEGAVPVIENQSELTSTVGKELDFVAAHFAKSLDASLQVDDANTKARANIEVEDADGNPVILATDIPATALLSLEKKMLQLRGLADSIPTLDPAKGFTPDPSKGAGVYKAREVVKTRTKKENKVVVLYPATDKHPAQTQLVPEDRPVGQVREQEWSGLYTPAEKADVLSRIDVLLRAIRAARARANETPVDLNKRVGKSLLKFIFG